MKKILLTLIICCICLTGCGEKITEGEIYEKEFLPEETQVMIVPMVHTNGKTSYTTYMPVTHHYPDRWRISIKSLEKMKTVNTIQRITTQRKKYITAVKLEICSLTRRIETTRKNRLRRANKRRKETWNIQKK